MKTAKCFAGEPRFMQNHSFKKILWAVDIESDLELSDQTVKNLRPLLAQSHAEVEPVYVLSSRTQIAATHLPLWQRLEASAKETSEKRLRGIVSQSELPNITHPTVLIDNQSSLSHAVQLVVSEAQSRNADVIVVSTHARKGLSRFILGSFAETMLLQSKKPVLAINPMCQAPERITRVLFPTDFSQPSRRGFEHTLELCKQLQATLTLYSKALEPIPSAFPEAPILYEYFAEETKLMRKTGMAWKDWGQSRGVDVQFAFDDFPGRVSDEILKFAKSGSFNLISMVAQSGPISSAILGSVTREVLRNAQCPVLVQHTK